MRHIIRDRVDKLLIDRGIKTLAELHERIQAIQPGFAWQTLSLAVNGKRYPRLDTLDAIAQGCETTVAYLIGEVDDPAPRLDHPLIVRDQTAIYEIDDGQIRTLLSAWEQLSELDRTWLVKMAQDIAHIRPRIIGDDS